MFCCPCRPKFGDTVVIIGTDTAAATVNPFANVSTSVFVVSVTSRGPRAATGSMVSTAVALVVLLTFNDATTTPAPKLAVVIPCAQFVNWPVKLTFRFCWPCCPELGLIEIIAGLGAGLTEMVTFAVPVSCESDPVKLKT